MPNILDLDELAPEKKEASFTDRNGKKRKVDISFVSFKTGMIVIKHMDVFTKAANNPKDMDEEIFDIIFELLAQICSESDEELTKYFLQSNLSVTQAVQLLTAAMEPIMQWVASNQIGAAVEKGKAKKSG